MVLTLDLRKGRNAKENTDINTISLCTVLSVYVTFIIYLFIFLLYFIIFLHLTIFSPKTLSHFNIILFLYLHSIFFKKQKQNYLA